jgi:hypothetical protein
MDFILYFCKFLTFPLQNNSSKLVPVVSTPAEEINSKIAKPLSPCQSLLLGLYQAFRERDSIFLGKFLDLVLGL